MSVAIAHLSPGLQDRRSQSVGVSIRIVSIALPAWRSARRAKHDPAWRSATSKYPDKNPPQWRPRSRLVRVSVAAIKWTAAPACDRRRRRLTDVGDRRSRASASSAQRQLANGARMQRRLADQNAVCAESLALAIGHIKEPIAIHEAQSRLAPFGMGSGTSMREMAPRRRARVWRCWARGATSAASGRRRALLRCCSARRPDQSAFEKFLRQT
jgi:hypothetical protein